MVGSIFFEDGLMHISEVRHCYARVTVRLEVRDRAEVITFWYLSMSGSFIVGWAQGGEWAGHTGLHYLLLPRGLKLLFTLSRLYILVLY